MRLLLKFLLESEMLLWNSLCSIWAHEQEWKSDRSNRNVNMEGGDSRGPPLGQGTAGN